MALREGEIMPKPPVWLDPLNKAMGMVPEPILRGTQAFEGAVTPEMAPPAEPGGRNLWEEYVAGNIPQGARDFADFMGIYAGMAGFDPGAAGGPGHAAKFIGGLPATRSKAAQGLQQIRKATEVGAPVRKGILAQSRKGITLQEELPQEVIDYVEQLRKQGTIPQDVHASASYSRGQGAPGGTLALPESAGVSIGAHEITHAGTEGARAADLVAMQNKVNRGAKVHPRAAYAKRGYSRMNETISYTIQDLVEGKASDIMKMDEGLRADVFKYLARNWAEPVPPRLSDFAQTPASKVPLMEKEIDPLLRALELK